MHIVRADHLVLTVRDIEATVEWYGTVLGMRPVTFGDGRQALAFGDQKLNLHQAGRELEPKAARPVPGSADVCLISGVALADVREHLDALAVPIELGPVARTGATGPITSVYLRDPDGNLVEVGSVGGGDRSPALSWSGAPEGTRGYAVTCYDPDALTGSGFWHWVLLGLPVGCTRLPGDAGRGGHLPAGALHLRNDFGIRAYAGAAPPDGDPAHRYLFAVHALDTDDLAIPADADGAYAGFLLTAHTIARGVLRPTYRRN